MTNISNNVNSNLQWKYLELESRNPIISKIISSNIVNDKAKVTENMSWTDTFRTS